MQIGLLVVLGSPFHHYIISSFTQQNYLAIIALNYDRHPFPGGEKIICVSLLYIHQLSTLYC